jgi:hypothetical protein
MLSVMLIPSALTYAFGSMVTRRRRRSAILSAVIFNALIIIALIPLALKGVTYRAEPADRLLSRNLLIYGLAADRALHRHQINRLGVSPFLYWGRVFLAEGGNWPFPHVIPLPGCDAVS